MLVISFCVCAFATQTLFRLEPINENGVAYALSPIDQVKSFLAWFKCDLSDLAMGGLFGCPAGTIQNTRSMIMQLLETHLVPMHIGFGPKHVIRVGDDWVPLTADVAYEHLSSFRSR